MNVQDLQPKEIWENFSKLNAVPRASKKEARVIKFMEDFGHSLNLPTYTDQVGNVIIKKPATKGMENKATIALQSHLDMVHQKNGDTIFDFDTEGIKMYVDGDWVKAQGTTLGADNGIGVATIMGLLASTTIPHPALEALFNVGAHDIRYRIARSIAVLLGKDAEDSDYLFEAVSKAYEVRSKLVHTGKAKGIDSVWLWQLQRAVQRAIVRCLTLAQPKESLSRQLTRLGFGQGRALVTSPLLQTSALDSLGSRKSKSRDVA